MRFNELSWTSHSRRGRSSGRAGVPESNGVVFNRDRGKALDNRLEGARNWEDGPISRLLGRGMVDSARDSSVSFFIAAVTISCVPNAADGKMVITFGYGNQEVAS